MRGRFGTKPALRIFLLNKQQERKMTHSTAASGLVHEYLRLGGTRKVVMDDNRISIRIWEDEPAAAAEFWTWRVDSLTRKEREEVETLLPPI
jgi:hypothetical protein